MCIEGMLRKIDKRTAGVAPVVAVVVFICERKMWMWLKTKVAVCRVASFLCDITWSLPPSTYMWSRQPGRRNLHSTPHVQYNSKSERRDNVVRACTPNRTYEYSRAR